jgi:hypothetical protein
MMVATMPETRDIWVTEVHNFGGFFGGDTVTLSAVPWPEGEEETLTIDERALSNIADRHAVAPQMLLRLSLSGARVDRAELLAAREYAALLHAVGSAALETNDASQHADIAPRVRAYRCARCDLWIDGQPPRDVVTAVCGLCGAPLT